MSFSGRIAAMSPDKSQADAQNTANSGADTDGSVGNNLFPLGFAAGDDDWDGGYFDPEAERLLALQAAEPDAWGATEESAPRDRRIDDRGRQIRRRRASPEEMEIAARAEVGLLPPPTALRGWFDDEDLAGLDIR